MSRRVVKECAASFAEEKEISVPLWDSPKIHGNKG